MILNHFILVAAIFVALDALWLKSTTRIYRKTLGNSLRATPRWIPVIIFYLLYTTGLLVFALQPGIDTRNAFTALWHGSLFGGIAYAVYALTNFAVLERWNTLITIMDICWGMLASGVSVWIAFILLGY